jgi:hypothetical protein
LRTSLRKVNSISEILRCASPMAACTRAICAVACSTSPWARLTSRSSRSTSTSETAPVASSGRVLVNSWREISSVRCAAARRARASVNSCSTLQQLLALIDMLELSSDTRDWYRLRSSSMMRCSSTSPARAAGGRKATPSAKAPSGGPA